jgi:hypothetical protein
MQQQDIKFLRAFCSCNFPHLHSDPLSISVPLCLSPLYVFRSLLHLLNNDGFPLPDLLRVSEYAVLVYAVCFKKNFTTLKAHTIYLEDMHSASNCHNVGKHTEFYLG